MKTTNSNEKIPGMLYILVSFIPRIIYWVLCGMGNVLGIVVPLANWSEPLKLDSLG